MTKTCNTCGSKWSSNSRAIVCLRCQPTDHEKRTAFWRWFVKSDPEMHQALVEYQSIYGPVTGIVLYKFGERIML